MKCPNIKDPEYIALASVVGEAKAHTIWNENNGNPVSLTADGKPSLIHSQLVDMYGEKKAIRLRTEMFSDKFKETVGSNKITGIDANGNIITSNGLVIALEQNTQQSSAIQKTILRKEYVESQHKTNTLLDIMRSAVPSIRINEKTFNQLQGTKHVGERAWVDNDGINVNTQSIHFTTPVHELTHIWIHYLEMTDKQSYDMFMNSVEESINDNKELFSTIKQNYPNNTRTQLLYEYAATVSGITSEKDVKKFLNRNNRYVTDERSKSIYSRISDMVRKFYTALKNVIGKLSHNGETNLSKIDFSKANMQQIFDALKMDILSGNPIINMGTEEMKVFLDNYYTPGFHEAQVINLKTMNKLNDIFGITSVLINNDQVSLSGNNQFENAEYVEHLIKDIDSRWINDKKGNYYTYSYSKRYQVPQSMTVAERHQYIKDNIIPTMETMVTSFNDNIKEVINRSLEKNDISLEEHIHEVFKSFKLSDRKVVEIYNALAHLGINAPISFILNYEELQKNSQFSFLYKDIIKGNNPLIIVHGYSDKMIDISIVDLASGVLGRQDNILTGTQVNLASALGKPNDDFSFNNSKADIRKVILSTTLAGMNQLAQESGIQLRVRKSGVIGFNGNKVLPYMNKSLKEAFKNSRDLFMLSEVQEIMNPLSPNFAWFNGMINNNLAWDANSIIQTWPNIVESYYSTYYLETGMSEEERNMHINNIGSWEHYGIIKKRLRILEKRKDWIKDPEHQMLSMYALHFRKGISINNSQINDIDSTFLKWTNVHNIQSDILQHVSIEFENAKSLVVDQVNEYKAEFTKLLEESLQSHGTTIMPMGNPSMKVFGHLFKVGKITLNEDYNGNLKGSVIETKLWNQLYGSYNLKEAKDAGLTDADIKFSDYILSTVRERYIENLLHQEELKNKPLSLEEITAYVDERLLPGTIPVLPSTDIELMRKGKFKQAYGKFIDKIATGEYIPAEIASDDFKQLHSRFQGQIEVENQLLEMGLVLNNTMGATNISDNQYASVNMKAYEEQTANLEYMFIVFTHDSIRNIEFDRHVLPTYNDARQMIHILEKEIGIDQTHTKDFLEQYYERIVERKNRDPKNKTTTIARTIMSAYTFISLGYRPSVWMRSGYYNIQNQLIESLATVASNIGTDEAKQLNFPSPADMGKATALMVTDFQKIYALGKKFSIINSSEMEVIDSFFTTNIDKSPFQKQIAHIGNYYTDVASRLTTMVGFMLHDGSYDAHSFDTETLKLRYDVTKDERFYKDGNWKSDKAKMLFENMRDEQLYYGGLLKEGEDMQVGYSYEETNTRFKWYSDKYIIGSMDEYQKILQGNTWTGQLFTQFRTYLPDKIFNWFGSQRKTFYGAVSDVQLDADNNWEVIKQQIMIEGSMASMWNMLKDVYQIAKLKDKGWDDLKTLIVDADPMVKYNIANVMVRAMLFAGILATLAILYNKGLTDRQRKSLQWMYGDLMIWGTIQDLKSSAMPIAGLIDNIMSLVTGEANWRRLMKYTGPTNDIIAMLEFMDPSKDILKNQEYRKEKAKEKREKRKIHDAVMKQAKLDASNEI